MAEGVAPQLVPLRKQHLQIFRRKDAPGRCLTTHQAEGRIIGSRHPIGLQDGAARQQCRAREIIKSEGNNRRFRNYCKWPTGKSTRSNPLILRPCGFFKA